MAGSDQVFPKSNSIHDLPAREEGHHEFFHRESGGSQPQDQETDDIEARDFFWSISLNYMYHHRVERRVKLCVVSVSDENHVVLTVHRLVRLALLHS